MLKTTVLMITSFKGGVGKSTLAANLAYALARRGRNTLLIDCDFNMRCLDMILGHDESIIYDVTDVLLRNIPFDKVVIADSRSSNLLFCPAPFNYTGGITSEMFSDFITNVSEKYRFDFIVLDTPGDSDEQLRLAACVSDIAAVVATCHLSSVRAAEKTASVLENYGVAEQRLVINMFNTGDNDDERGLTLPDIIDKTRLRLLGIVPYEGRLAAAQDSGILLDDGAKNSTNASYAIGNIADRMLGRNVPLFSHFRGIRRNRLIRY